MVCSHWRNADGAFHLSISTRAGNNTFALVCLFSQDGCIVTVCIEAYPRTETARTPAIGPELVVPSLEPRLENEFGYFVSIHS